MKIKTKLALAFGVVTLTTLAISAFGFVQTRKLSSALYEIAVVRIPSVEALNGIEKALLELKSLESNDAVKAQRDHAWGDFERGWTAYETLPQTREESEAWQRFGTSAREWQRNYAASSINPNAFTNVLSLLGKVIAINNDIVAAEKRRTIATFADAQRAQRAMFFGGALALSASIAVGFVCGRSLTDRLHTLTESLDKIAHGNLDTRIPTTTDDELGEVAAAANQMVAERKRVEETVRESREQLRALAARLQAVREEERIRIAREIHDVLAQDLTRLKFGLASIGRRVTVGPIDYYPPSDTPAALSSVADSAIQTVQKIAAELRPIALDSLGLAAAIDWLAEDFQRRTGIQCDAVVPDEDLPIDRNAATNIFRIVQESLTNVIRHADASRVEIILEQNPDSLLLIIQDNGKGFDPARMKDRNSLGLLGMRERAAMLQGRFAIGGSPGKGTEIRLTVPLPSRAGETAVEPSPQI